MRLQSNRPDVTPMAIFRRPACPRCGNMLFAAAATAFAGKGRILHTWSCDRCDHEFHTTFEVPSREA